MFDNKGKYRGSSFAGIGPDVEDITGTMDEFCKANDAFYSAISSIAGDSQPAYVFTEKASEDLGNGVNKYGASA